MDFFETAKKQTLGEKIDELEQAEAALEAAAVVVKEKQRAVEALQAELLDLFTKDELSGALGTHGATAKIERKSYPGISDRDLFNAFVKENDAFDLFTAKVNSKAYKERVESNVEIPGVSVFTKVAIKLTPSK